MFEWMWSSVYNLKENSIGELMFVKVNSSAKNIVNLKKVFVEIPWKVNFREEVESWNIW